MRSERAPWWLKVLAGGGLLFLHLPILLIFAVFWLLILRPARQRQRAVMEVQAALAPGTEVVTAAGLYGSVVAVEGDVVVLEVAPGVTNRYARQAIVRVVPPTDPAAPATESPGAVGGAAPAVPPATATPAAEPPRTEPERGPGG